MIAGILKNYAPSRARKRVVKDGGSLVEANQAYDVESVLIYRASKNYAALGGWCIIGLILAIHGDYPPIAVTLSWILAFTFFVMNVFQALFYNGMKNSTKSILGYTLMPVGLIMIVATTWFLIVASKVIFS